MTEKQINELREKQINKLRDMIINIYVTHKAASEQPENDSYYSPHDLFGNAEYEYHMGCVDTAGCIMVAMGLNPENEDIKKMIHKERFGW